MTEVQLGSQLQLYEGTLDRDAEPATNGKAGDVVLHNGAVGRHRRA